MDYVCILNVIFRHRLDNVFCVAAHLTRNSKNFVISNNVISSNFQKLLEANLMKYTSYINQFDHCY